MQVQRVDAQIPNLHKIVLERPDQQILPSGNAQLPVNRICVGFDGTYADVQIVGDFLVGLARHHARDYFQLPPREPAVESLDFYDFLPLRNQSSAVRPSGITKLFIGLEVSKPIACL